MTMKNHPNDKNALIKEKAFYTEFGYQVFLKIKGNMTLESLALGANVSLKVIKTIISNGKTPATAKKNRIALTNIFKVANYLNIKIN